MLAKKFDYVIGNMTYVGYLAYPDQVDQPRPAVLVAHDWSGRNEFADKKAEALAELGYVGFAIDMYGQGRTGATVEEKSQLMKPLVEHREQLLKRIKAAFVTVQNLTFVDLKRIAAMGFCFGGLCVLDLARGEAELCGAISFHGLLHAPNLPQQSIQSRILALHGHDDPMVPPDQVLAFQTEMTQAKADWQMHIYGHTQHAFTNPLAHDQAMGTVYNEKTCQRAWLVAQNFLTEIFA
jgi:dienelactone hydrolase